MLTPPFQRAQTLPDERDRQAQELERLYQHAELLARELAAAEVQLRELTDTRALQPRRLQAQLQNRRVLYVGGRPSSIPAIRELVQQHGGTFQRHEGGLEDRQGLLDAAVAAADWVLFPVDCIDHESAGRLKRLASQRGIPCLPLRSACVTSFVAAVAASDGAAGVGQAGVCLRHG